MMDIKKAKAHLREQAYKFRDEEDDKVTIDAIETVLDEQERCEALIRAITDANLMALGEPDRYILTNWDTNETTIECGGITVGRGKDALEAWRSMLSGAVDISLERAKTMKKAKACF